MSQENNNLYDILNNFNKLSDSAAEKPAAPKANTLLESTMEQVVSEKYQGWKKTVSAIEKGGSADNPEAVAAAIGRKKYGKEKFQKAAATGKKLAPKNVSEGETKQTSTGRVHKGTYGTSYDDDYKAPPTQRGRGRPRLGADSTTGEVMKPDWSAFSTKVSPKTKLPTTRHKMVGEEGVEEGAYGRRGDAYERDIENSEYGMQGGRRDKAGLEMDAEEWFIVKDDGKMYKVSIFPTQRDAARNQGFSPSRAEAKAKAGSQGVAEGKEDKIKQLRQDYADKLRWSKEAHDPAQQRQHRIGASRIADHLKKQYGVDVEQGVAEGMNDWALKDKHTPRSIPRTSEKNNWSKKDIHNRAHDFPPTNYDKDGKDMYGQKKPELKSQAEGVAEGSIGDKIKGAAKSVKRGLQGWAGTKMTPGSITKRTKELTDPELDDQIAGHTRYGLPEPGKHSPRGFQARVHNREKRKRDVGTGEEHFEEGVAEGQVNEMSPKKLDAFRKKARAVSRDDSTPDNKKIKHIVGAQLADKKIMAKTGNYDVSEGYILKRTNVDKYVEPGDEDDYTDDMKVKNTDYEIINNKTGQVVGVASWTTNDYFGPGALKITMKNGPTRWLDIYSSEKGNPQSAFNRFVKDPKTSKKYKDQGVSESDSSGVTPANQKPFLIKAELDDGSKKTFRVRAQNEQQARDKFAQHYNNATVVSVEEEEEVSKLLSILGVRPPVKPNPKLWSQLQQAPLINRILASVKEHPQQWAEAMQECLKVYRWYDAYESADNTRIQPELAHDKERNEIYSELGRQVNMDRDLPALARRAVDSALKVLVTYTTRGEIERVLKTPSEKLSTEATTTGMPVPVMMLPAVRAFEKIKALGQAANTKNEQQGVAEGRISGYRYKDTDLGTYITNPKGEILWVPEVSLENQGFSQGDLRLPEVWQMNLEIAGETGARILKRGTKQGVAENFGPMGAPQKRNKPKSASDYIEKPERWNPPKPDFLDLDKDGNKKEPMRKAASDAKSTQKNKGQDVKEDSAKKFGVFNTGGSIGKRDSGKPVKSFDSKEEASAYASRLNKQVSAGEREHYKIKYVVKPIKNVSEGETKQTSTGRVHKGTYGTSYDDDYKAPPTQRGRGRPRLGADSTTGEVMKPDWSAFSTKVSPKTKLPTTRHKMVGEEGVNEAAKWRSNPDAYDTIPNSDPNGPHKVSKGDVGRNTLEKHWHFDAPLTAKSRSSIMTKMGIKAQAGKHGPKGVLPEQGGAAISEKAKSKQQQKFFGMAHALQKGEKVKGASPELKKVASTMGKQDVKDFAATKHKGLPKKVSEGRVKELAMDLDSMTDAAFLKKYQMTKAQARKNMSNTAADKAVKETYSKINSMINEEFGEDDSDSAEEPQLTYEQEQLKEALGEDLYTELSEIMMSGETPSEELYSALAQHFRDSGEMPPEGDEDESEWLSNKVYEIFSDSMTEGAYTQHYMDANKPSKVRQSAEAGSQKYSDIEPVDFKDDPIQATTDRALKYGAKGLEKVQGMVKRGLGEAVCTTCNQANCTCEDSELSEMMHLSGLTLEAEEVEEGNEFTLARKEAIKAGKDTFTVAGKTYNVTGDTSDEKKIEECYDGSMSPMTDAGQTAGDISVNSSMSSRGDKSVTVTATGDQADMLNQLLSLAGLAGSAAAQPEASPEVEVMSMMGADQEMSEEKDPRYQASTTPEEHVLPVQALTKGGNGEVAGKEKKMTSRGYNFGDNPLAMKESNMSARLMREYDSIKLHTTKK